MPLLISMAQEAFKPSAVLEELVIEGSHPCPILVNLPSIYKGDLLYGREVTEYHSLSVVANLLILISLFGRLVDWLRNDLKPIVFLLIIIGS